MYLSFFTISLHVRNTNIGQFNMGYGLFYLTAVFISIILLIFSLFIQDKKFRLIYFFSTITFIIAGIFI